MNIKKVIVCGLLIASCSGKSPVQPGATSTNPTNPIDGSGAPATQAPQGTITSSGGYLFGYETNPWFLENTENVKYCLDIDEQNFGLNRASSEELIKNAIGIWKQKLSAATYSQSFDYTIMPFRKIRIGSQNFVSVSCEDHDVDLRFQFGKLNRQQQLVALNPRQFVANTYQTDYDEINMRGKGFIYLAPEGGDLRPISKNSHDKFWSATGGVSTLGVLIHELGHVFGFSHEKYSIMDERYPQTVIGIESVEEISSSQSYFRQLIDREVEGLFGYTQNAQIRIDAQKNPNDMFGKANSNDHVVKCEFTNDHLIKECAAYELQREESGQVIVSKKVGVLETLEQRPITSPFLAVKLPDSQTVFQITGNTATSLTELNALDYRSFWCSGIYKSLDGNAQIPMTIRSRPGYPADLDVEVVIDGVVVKI